LAGDDALAGAFVRDDDVRAGDFARVEAFLVPDFAPDFAREELFVAEFAADGRREVTRALVFAADFFAVDFARRAVEVAFFWIWPATRSPRFDAASTARLARLAAFPAAFANSSARSLTASAAA